MRAAAPSRHPQQAGAAEISPMSTYPGAGARARLRTVLPDTKCGAPIDPAPVMGTALHDVRDEEVLVIGSHGLEVMCDLLRRGARSVTLLRMDKRPEAHSASLVVVPDAPAIERLACVLGHARRALLPTGRLVLRVGGLAGRQLTAQITGMLRTHGYAAIVAQQSGDELVLNAEIPGFGRQLHA
jgi:hypothetical protein